MRATAAKASRRDIRRAFGPEALKVINAQGAAVLQLQEWTKATDAVLREFFARGFWGRLRWLLRGR